MNHTIFPPLVRKPAVFFDSEFDRDVVYLAPKMSIPNLIPTQMLGANRIFKTKPQYKYKNIILDLDGTLLDNIPVGLAENPNPGQITPIARPYLAELMEFVFEHFERVSIWTAAMPGWYEKCYNAILRHHIPANRRFDFVKTRNPMEEYIVLKPLSEVYVNFAGKYNPENTLIVDDNPATYRANPENAVGVKSFFYDQLSKTQRENLEESDTELLVLIEELRIKLADSGK